MERRREMMREKGREVRNINTKADTKKNDIELKILGRRAKE